MLEYSIKQKNNFTPGSPVSVVDSLDSCPTVYGEFNGLDCDGIVQNMLYIIKMGVIAIPHTFSVGSELGFDKDGQWTDTPLYSVAFVLHLDERGHSVVYFNCAGV